MKLFLKISFWVVLWGMVASSGALASGDTGNILGVDISHAVIFTSLNHAQVKIGDIVALNGQVPSEEIFFKVVGVSDRLSKLHYQSLMSKVVGDVWAKVIVGGRVTSVTQADASRRSGEDVVSEAVIEKLSTEGDLISLSHTRGVKRDLADGKMNGEGGLKGAQVSLVHTEAVSSSSELFAELKMPVNDPSRILLKASDQGVTENEDLVVVRKQIARQQEAIDVLKIDYQKMTQQYRAENALLKMELELLQHNCVEK